MKVKSLFKFIACLAIFSVCNLNAANTDNVFMYPPVINGVEHWPSNIIDPNPPRPILEDVSYLVDSLQKAFDGSGSGYYDPSIAVMAPLEMHVQALVTGNESPHFNKSIINYSVTSENAETVLHPVVFRLVDYPPFGRTLELSSVAPLSIYSNGCAYTLPSYQALICPMPDRRIIHFMRPEQTARN